MEPSEVEKTVSQYLGMPCKAKSVEFQIGRNVFRSSLVTEEHPHIPFSAELDGKSRKLVRVNFYQLYWRHAYKERLHEKVGELFEKFALDVSFYSSKETSKDASEYKDLDSLLQLEGAENSTEMRLYLFGQPNLEDYRRVRKLVQSHKEMNLARSAFEIRFYSPETYSAPPSYRYGFKASRKDWFESVYREKCLSGLLFTLAESEPIPSAEAMLEAQSTNLDRSVLWPHKFEVSTDRKENGSREQVPTGISYP